MNYLDANVFIHAITGDQSAQQILFKAANREIEASTSCLSWDEFVWVLRKQRGTKNIFEESRTFLSLPFISFQAVDTRILDSAHRLMDAYNLKPRDSIHAATALSSGIKTIISDDADFDKVPELKRIAIRDAAGNS